MGVGLIYETAELAGEIGLGSQVVAMGHSFKTPPVSY
jgi:hypothetical protein